MQGKNIIEIKLTDGIPANTLLGCHFFMGRDPVEHAKRAKYKPPAMLHLSRKRPSGPVSSSRLPETIRKDVN